MNSIPIFDNQGKDVLVQWKMLDGFDTNKTFYTDTNGLEMAQRTLNQKPGFDFSNYA
jgi:hypothetical protein